VTYTSYILTSKNLDSILVLRWENITMY